MFEESILNSRILIKLGFQIWGFLNWLCLNEIDSASVLVNVLIEGFKCQFDKLCDN